MANPCFTIFGFGKRRRSRRKSRRVSKRKSRRSRRAKRSRRSRRSRRSGNIPKFDAFAEYMHNGMTNQSFRRLPKNKKIEIVKSALKVVKHKGGRQNMLADLKYLQKKSRRSRRFGYSHDMGPKLYNVHMDDGILLADNAFSWMGNPLGRALNAGSG